MGEPTQQSLSKSFLLPMYAGLFHWLRRLSVFTIVRHFIPDKHYHVFVDCYLLANLTIAAFCFAVLPIGKFNLITVPFLAYGAWRCFELIVLHLNQVFFDEYRVLRDGLPVDPLNYRRLILSIIHNYVELVFWFAFFYRQLAWHFSRKAPLEDAWTALYFSVVTQATVGYGDATPTDWIGRALMIAQIALGVFLVIAVLARWLSIMRDTKRDDKIT